MINEGKKQVLVAGDFGFGGERGEEMGDVYMNPQRLPPSDSQPEHSRYPIRPALIGIIASGSNSIKPTSFIHGGTGGEGFGERWR